jgi:hypothetical protein
MIKPADAKVPVFARPAEQRLAPAFRLVRRTAVREVDQKPIEYVAPSRK